MMPEPPLPVRFLQINLSHYSLSRASPHAVAEGREQIIARFKGFQCLLRMAVHPQALTEFAQQLRSPGLIRCRPVLKRRAIETDGLVQRHQPSCLVPCAIQVDHRLLSLPRFEVMVR